MIKCVTFDLEGPVINLEPVHHAAHRLAASEIGLELTLEDCLQKLPHFIGGPDEAVAKDIVQLAGTDEEFISQVLSRKKFHYDRLLKEFQLEPRPGFLGVFEWLRKNGVKTMLGPALPYSRADVLLKKSGLDRLFNRESIVSEDDIRFTKPAPDIYVETARRAGVDITEQIVFEDSPRGMIAVRRAGSIGIGMPVYNRPSTLKALVDAGAVRICMDWREMNIGAVIENLNQELSIKR